MMRCPDPADIVLTLEAASRDKGIEKKETELVSAGSGHRFINSETRRFFLSSTFGPRFRLTLSS